MKRRLASALGVLILTAVLVIGLTQAGGESGGRDEHFDLGAARRQLAGAPAPLAALHAQSAQLLGGGVRAFERRLAALKGYPIVINKWASWCTPCRAEFPELQKVATERGKRIAFLGVDGHDPTGPARKFLAQRPLPYPSYMDPDEKIAQRLGAPGNYPITVFVDARGRIAFRHQGAYPSSTALRADIDRYLGA